jgi:hypothetical protein
VWESDNYCAWAGACRDVGGGGTVAIDAAPRGRPGILPALLDDLDGESSCMRHIHLVNMEGGLSGSLLQDWGRLARLRRLSLYKRNSSATLPAAWGGMRSLSSLRLLSVGLTGRQPSSCGARCLHWGAPAGRERVEWLAAAVVVFADFSQGTRSQLQRTVERTAPWLDRAAQQGGTVPRL